MIYPKFIQEGQTIGICAPSAGVGSKIEAFEESTEVLRQAGYRVKETASVRRNASRSTGPRKRAKELDELIKDPDVRLPLISPSKRRHRNRSGNVPTFWNTSRKNARKRNC